VSGAEKSLSEMVPAEVTLHQCNARGRMRSTFFELRRKYAECAVSYDLVVPTSPHTLAIATGGKIPVLPWVHFTWEGFKPFLRGLLKVEVSLLYPFQRRMVQVSPSGMKAMPAMYGKQGWQHIPNLFDPNLYSGTFEHSPLLDRLRSSGRPVLGYIGRLAPEKGINRLVAVHRELIRRGYKHWLVIAGEGPAKAELSQEEGVFLLGTIHNPLPFMQSVDALLLTSYHEAWPTVITEALWAQTPVVAYDCPTGPRDMLIGSLSSGLVPDGDTREFADRVERSISTGRIPLSNQDRLDFLAATKPSRVVASWLETIHGKLGATG